MTFPSSQPEWQKALEDLPSTPDRIPAFFFGHGSPMLAMHSTSSNGRMGEAFSHQGPNGPLAGFLRDFGPALLRKYRPKAILVISAHWETDDQMLVTDYGDENPLLMDYYGFQRELYELKFKSRGDAELSRHVVEVLERAGIPARTSPASEPRGMDGRGFSGPGLDHGVFVPFRIMFGEEFTSIPIVQLSFDGSLDPRRNWTLGEALQPLRDEGILILCGGLTIHNLRDFSAFSEATASPIYKQFDQAILDALNTSDANGRSEALFALTSHLGFRAAHPREDHFVPIYVAAGAGGTFGNAKILSAVYGGTTAAFGL